MRRRGNLGARLRRRAQKCGTPPYYKDDYDRRRTIWSNGNVEQQRPDPLTPLR